MSLHFLHYAVTPNGINDHPLDCAIMLIDRAACSVITLG